MKYDHMVKIGGKYYSAGEDIPDEETVEADETPLPFSDSDITFEEQPVKKEYTKTEISHMSTAELQVLAAQEGIENAYNTSGSELKKILIGHFEL